MNKSTKIAILGSQGSLGEYMCDMWKEKYTLLPFTRSELDITDFISVREKLTQLKPDILINCTAYNAVDACEQDSEEKKKAELINGYAVENLGIITNELEIPLVHYSTDYVFDGTKKDGYKEEDPISPINSYGKTKALGEELLKQTTQQYYNIRVSWLFGEKGSGTSTKKSFVDIVRFLAATKDELQLVDDEYSSPTYYKDIVTTTEYILQNQLPFGIYHVTNSGTTNWYEYGKHILSLLHISKPVHPISGSAFQRPAKRPHFNKLLNTKLPPLRSWQEALSEFLTS